MTAYRFCRTDDVPLLVRAHNACYAEPTGTPTITVEDFRRWRQELDVWCSSCMVAFEGSETVGVLIAAKRPHASWIHRIGVRPEHRRRGHARHMLESLARKMAILEPRRLLAEVPADNEAAKTLFQTCGYCAGDTLVDWVAEPLAETRPPEDGASAVGLVEGLLRPVEVTWAQIAASGPLTLREPGTWLRSEESLVAIRDQLRGLAVVSDVCIEAWLLFRDLVAPPRRELVAMSSSTTAHHDVLLRVLLLEARRAHSSAVLNRADPREASSGPLARAGFGAAGRHIFFSSDASPT